MGTTVPSYRRAGDQQADIFIVSSNPPHANHSNSLHGGAAASSAYPPNPYLQVTPVSAAPGKGPLDSIMKALDRCGKKLEDTTRRAGTAADNLWNHLRAAPSLTDAAMSRLAQGTRVLAEGGHEGIFRQIFGILPGEELRKAYACYLSTSTGPVIGTLYLSNTRLAFYSDNPIRYTAITGYHSWVHYKVVVQLNRLMAVTPTANKLNPSERYIQVLTVDGHEFWFMGFVSYDKAVKNLTEALRRHSPAAHR